MSKELKDALLRQFIRLRKTAGLVTLGLLIVNQALLVAGYIQWRGFSPYIIIPSIVVFLAALAVLGSNFLWLTLGLYHNETAAQVSHNPQTVYAINPYQEMVWRTYHLPKLQAMAMLATHLGNPKTAARFRQIYDQWQTWVDDGYIPKHAFPDHLKHHYLADEGDRL